MVILGIGSLVASGVLFTHKRLTVYLATSAILWEAHWLLLTLLDRTVAQESLSTTIFFSGAIIITLCWLTQWRRLQLPGIHHRLSLSYELPVLLTVIILIIGAIPILTSNGWHGDTWVMHGFYNGDTTTLVSLIHKSLSEPGLVNTSPFAATPGLEYPTLLHAGLATAISFIGMSADVLGLLPALIYLGIIATMPLFFLVWDTLVPDPVGLCRSLLGRASLFGIHAIQFAITMYVVALSWDAYVYPQSHFFITGLYLLLVGLLGRLYTLQGKAQLPIATVSVGIVLMLALANAVTGSAAVVAFVVVSLLRYFDTTRKAIERNLFALSALLIVIFFILVPPGHGSLGLVPHFSYTAAVDMLRLAVPLLVILIASWWYVDQQPYVPGFVVSISALSIIAFVFSDRDIIVANASRFFYHAILASFPIVLLLLYRTSFWLVEEWRNKSHRTVARIIGSGGVGLFLALLAVPPLISGAVTYDKLLGDSQVVVPPNTIAGLNWLQAHTDPQAIILAKPQSPWLVPLFTGRTLLRTDYWLDPDDETTHAVELAFAGNELAQQAVVPLADYVVLSASEREQWPGLGQPVFTNDTISIFRNHP